MYRLVTCPESAHLELIEYDDPPCGMLIQACSRFRPSCAVDCPRTCAARFDRRGRSAVQPTDFSIVFEDSTASVRTR